MILLTRIDFRFGLVLLCFLSLTPLSFVAQDLEPPTLFVTSLSLEEMTEQQHRLVQTLEPEFNDTSYVRGTLSMAPGEELASASTSFFICIHAATELDHQYTAFVILIDGLDVVSLIESVATDGERPIDRVEVTTIRVIRR